MANSKVTVIIPHFNGVDILRRCLRSLEKTQFHDFSVLVIDNGSTDRSVSMVRSEFPNVEINESKTNLGFAGGCNQGIRLSKSPYIALLNNDAEVTPQWLNPMIRLLDGNDQVAAVQPKVLSIHDRSRFDYCGAAGGEIDLFGYPFARGRMFHVLEIDQGQYDIQKEIFWATGAATLLRRSALNHVGLLDESFFAHMEEIDLNWRLHLAGYKIMAAPDAVVYHQTGGTLGEAKLQKMILNHRNSLTMVLKNYAFESLLWIFPLRLLLEGITLLGSLFLRQPNRAVAVAAGIGGALLRFKTTMKGRLEAQAVRRVSDSVLLSRMYRGSIALAFFLKRIRYYHEL